MPLFLSCIRYQFWKLDKLSFISIDPYFNALISNLYTMIETFEACIDHLNEN